MSAAGPNDSRRAVWVALLLIVGTLAVYWPIGQHEFVDHDDGPYVFRNELIQQGITWPGVVRAFTGVHHINWHPLTTLSFMLDCQLFGLNAGAHHLVSLALHALNSVLLFLLLRRMTSAFWPSFVVAALFAWHPLRVESVAWVAERKDVLSGLFWLLTIWSYVRYVERPGAGRYSALVLTYALGTMTKPMVVTLPFVLLLLDVWPLRRRVASAVASENEPPAASFGRERPRPYSWWQLVMEKLPLFALSALLSVITFRVQQQGGVVIELARHPLAKRAATALAAYGLYLKKTFWPSDLAVFYPMPASWGWSWLVLATVVLIAITAGALLTLRRHPYYFVGWSWFLGVLVPVIGLAQAGAAALADRYTYIPLIGVFIVLAWGLPELTAKWRFRNPILIGVATLALAGSLAATAQQVRYWRNTSTLFEHALQVTKQNWVAHGNFGVALMREGKESQALPHLAEVVRLQPRDFKARFNLGVTLSKLGRADEALPHLQYAVQLRPRNPLAHTKLGVALAQQGLPLQATTSLIEALRLDPNQHEARRQLAVIQITDGLFQDAIDQLAYVLRAKPDDWSAHYHFGVALMSIGRPDDAIPHFAETLRYKPDYADAHISWARALAPKRQVDEVIAHYLEALRINPDSADAHADLGLVLAFNQGKVAEATPHFEAVVRLRPDDAQARQQLAYLFALQGKASLAIPEFRRALKLNPDSLDAIFSLAWLLATHHDASLRNGEEALTLARQAVELTQENSVEALSALAAAQAETGQFTEAAATAQKTLDLARTTDKQAMLPRIQEQLQRYQAGLPHREPDPLQPKK